MSDILQEYKDYYRSRMKRYEGDPNYTNSYATEKALFEAMDSCNELIEFKDKLGNLNELNAVAMVKDKYKIYLDHFERTEEKVRAQAPSRILSSADNYSNALDISTFVQEEEQKNSIEISMDEAVREFNDWTQLENIEVYSNAVVPDKYKASMEEYVNDEKQALTESYERLEENNQPWQAGWKLDLDQIWETRHRRLLPYSDEVVKQRREQANEITGR